MKGKRVAGIDKSKGKKRNWGICLLVWVTFGGLLLAVLYCSFQSLEDTQALSERLLTNLAARFSIVQEIDQMSGEEKAQLMYLFRQSGRILIFFALGLMGFIVSRITFPRINLFIQLILSGAVMVGIAAFAEKGKDFIDDRHYSYQEMLLSIYAALAGCICMAVLWIFGRLIAGLFKRRWV